MTEIRSVCWSGTKVSYTDYQKKSGQIYWQQQVTDPRILYLNTVIGRAVSDAAKIRYAEQARSHSRIWPQRTRAATQAPLRVHAGRTRGGRSSLHVLESEATLIIRYSLRTMLLPSDQLNLLHVRCPCERDKCTSQSKPPSTLTPAL